MLRSKLIQIIWKATDRPFLCDANIFPWHVIYGDPQPQHFVTLQWLHNEFDGVSNHRRLKCLFNCLFKCRSKKISMLCLTGQCTGNSPVTDELPALLPTVHVLQLPAWASMVMIRICRISLMYSVLAVSWNRVIFQIFAGKHSSWDNCHLLNKIVQGKCKVVLHIFKTSRQWIKCV